MQALSATMAPTQNKRGSRLVRINMKSGHFSDMRLYWFLQVRPDAPIPGLTLGSVKIFIFFLTYTKKVIHTP
ncbi:MAG: hypothetical protein U1E84_08955 [Rhodoferax sp.]